MWLNDLIHTAGEGLTLLLFSVFMSRVLGICIVPVFYLLPKDHLCTNRQLKHANQISMCLDPHLN